MLKTTAEYDRDSIIIIIIIIIIMCHHSPINEPCPLLGFFFLRRFSRNLFLQGEIVILTPNPQSEGAVLRIYTPGDRVPSYTPGHWVASVPQDRHFRYPLTWAPEGKIV
jgi:hypothetical protein